MKKEKLILISPHRFSKRQIDFIKKHGKANDMGFAETLRSMIDSCIKANEIIKNG